MSTLAVVEAILRDAAVPLSVRDIVQRAGESLPTKSKTPDTVVARDLSMDIKRKGEDSLFIRTSPGRYAIREQVMAQRAAEQQTAGAQPAQQTGGDGQSGQTTSVIGQSLSGERAGTRPATKAPNSTSGSGEEISA